MAGSHGLVPIARIERLILERFPDDFMLQLTPNEFRDLKFHLGASSWGGTRKLLRAFTEQGVAMLSSVLRSRRAVQVNIEIMRVFVRLRRMLQANVDLARKLADLGGGGAAMKRLAAMLREQQAEAAKLDAAIAANLKELGYGG